MTVVIPVYQPDLSGNEKKYVLDCVESSWISSRGAYVDRFESNFGQRIGSNSVTSVFNGTVALHLALHSLGIGPGDEVIVPTFTYIASVNTIAQTGAKPVFVDCTKENWMLEPDAVASKITSKTKAIMAVHLYGHPCDMDALVAIAEKFGVTLIEDAAEGFGTYYKGKHAGTFGLVGTFSFFGNKTITTGEGGMVVSSDTELMSKMKVVKNQGMSPTIRYWHDHLGFNYRMTNIAAAIGVAQLERADNILNRKREIGNRYRKNLQCTDIEFQIISPANQSSEWLISFLVPDDQVRERIVKHLDEKGIETRPVFHCAHTMPMYLERSGNYPVAENISSRGLSVPSFPALTNAQIDWISGEIQEIVRKG